MKLSRWMNVAGLALTLALTACVDDSNPTAFLETSSQLLLKETSSKSVKFVQKYFAGEARKTYANAQGVEAIRQALRTHKDLTVSQVTRVKSVDVKVGRHIVNQYSAQIFGNDLSGQPGVVASVQMKCDQYYEASNCLDQQYSDPAYNNGYYATDSSGENCHRAGWVESGCVVTDLKLNQ